MLRQCILLLRTASIHLQSERIEVLIARAHFITAGAIRRSASSKVHRLVGATTCTEATGLC